MISIQAWLMLKVAGQLVICVSFFKKLVDWTFSQCVVRHVTLLCFEAVSAPSFFFGAFLELLSEGSKQTSLKFHLAKVLLLIPRIREAICAEHVVMEAGPMFLSLQIINFWISRMRRWWLKLYLRMQRQTSYYTHWGWRKSEGFEASCLAGLFGFYDI